MRINKPIAILLLCLLTSLAACSNSNNSSYFNKKNNNTFKSIRGIGYTEKGQALYVASESGIHKFSESKWFSPSINKYDYSVLQTTDKGIFASGFAKPDSKKPLGLVISTNGGKTIKTISTMEKEAYQQLAVSYDSQSMYVLSQKKGAILYSKNGGKSWSRSKLKGLTSNHLGGMAAHPEQSSSFAIYAKEGIFLSNNFGESFTLFPTDGAVTAMAFGREMIVYSEMKENQNLIHILDLKTKTKSQLASITSQSLNNPVLYLAVNPDNNKEMAAATSKNEIFLTKGSGDSWKKITSNRKKKDK